MILNEAGISRQAYHQHQISRQEDRLIQAWVLDVVLAKRKKHPLIGLRKIYSELVSPLIGRDKFFAVGKRLRLNITPPKNYTRTTFSTKSNRYLNLLVDKEIKDINELWVTDITYIRIGENYAYLDMIMDVYSRRIVGYAISESLQATLCVEALEMALKNRKVKNYNGKLIHHSDKGTQYVFKAYIDLLNKYEIQVSMCNSAYENAHMERLNGIIKNEYIRPNHLDTFEKVKKQMPNIVQLYNSQRPHLELQFDKPTHYEEAIKQIPRELRKPMTIFVEEKTKTFQKMLYNHPQLNLF